MGHLLRLNGQCLLNIHNVTILKKKIGEVLREVAEGKRFNFGKN